MRETVSLNRKWAFVMGPERRPDSLPAPAFWVNLPHTWNAIDGQDGENDYYRGKCWYVKRLTRDQLPCGERVYLEICGANSSAEVWLNGVLLGRHEGGYSTWRVELTGTVSDDMLLAIGVDNSPNERVYPQIADFTFYGGLYRDVRLIGVPGAHFALMHHGGSGLAVTPLPDGEDARVSIESWLEGEFGGLTVEYTVRDAKGRVILTEQCPAEQPHVECLLAEAHLWQGREDPYLYTAEARLMKDGEAIDCVSARFGIRKFEIDPAKGFLLNGREYPLRGVSRHQDRWGMGNALLPEHHREDIDLICEVGANAVRLAHYQHDQYFYDLCDERGLIVWAEIPYISKHMPDGTDNTLGQLKELVLQNYNHACIAVWGLSNEITMGGREDRSLLTNHRMLNDLAHSLDKTRMTAVAAVSVCDTGSEYLRIPDAVAYNHYFGWYGGDTSMNGPWFDRFHQEHPDIPIGVSEYGCEALNWHTSHPEQGDYTEEYQAHYHEELIRQIMERRWLWASFVWNMFDFGADARSEGGENGQNHKGLVTFDRRYKKDAFYAYKAHWSSEPFVHICGKRYVDRAENTTRVTVYSNQPEVELLANGRSLGVKTAEDRFFRFDVPVAGETHLTALAGAARDESLIRHAEEFNEAYRMKEKSAVLNWFDIDAPDGYYSLNDKVSEVMLREEGRAVVEELLEGLGGKKAAGFVINDDMKQMMGSFTLLRLTGLLGMTGLQLTKEELLAINRRLNGIPKA